jgi:hypothetical protein
MTVRGFVNRNGWITDKVDVKETDKVMSVAVVFDSGVEGLDEVEFDIESYNTVELSGLFTNFCKENCLPVHTVQNVVITKAASSFEEL